MRIAIYPGSFDPLTNGHVSLIQRSLRMFDKVVVAIATNPKKTPLFTVAERKAILKAAFKDDRVEVDSFESILLVEYAKQKGAGVIVRGLRAVSDFEFEFQLANMNRKLSPDIETLFMMTGEDYFYISSNLVREVASLGGNVDDFVPQGVGKKLKAKFKGK
jgi:pantetheine-phosphate adenylyltransferase